MTKGVSSHVVLIIGLLLLSSLQILLEDVAVSGAPTPDPTKTLYVSGVYYIEDHQVWRDVLVRMGSRLVIANGGHLEASSIVLSQRCTLEVRSGLITLGDRKWTDRVGIFGECDRFIVTHQSVIDIKGPDGTYDIPTSRGADAGIDVTAMYTMRIEGSTITIEAGEGMSPPEPLTFGDLLGDQFAGGKAFCNLEVTCNDPLMVIKRATISVTGGDGGDAPDGLAPALPGEGGRGGGFTRGGDVSGSVARGGDASALLSGRWMDLQASVYNIDGGNGGDAGDGGPSVPGGGAGGGGGGYSGGEGAFTHATLPPMDGGDVAGSVGRGGDAILVTRGEMQNISMCGFDLHGGTGGAAGNGGASHGRGGGGGGGYSGGGGGAQGLWGGADGGAVTGHVGAGGDALINMTTDTFMDIWGSGLFARGGRGGASGDGGNVSSPGGGGGGGCSGGGGGAQGSEDGTRDGTDGGLGGQVGGFVAAGGGATIDMTSYSVVSIGCSIKAFGGRGGEEGEAGHYPAGYNTDTLGGAGGGGRSAGGGAGRGVGPAGDGSPGAASTVLEGVGSGGGSRNWMTSVLPTISADTAIVSRPGVGGEPLNILPEGELEGYSVSGDGYPGTRAIWIPMSRPLLVIPRSEKSLYELPPFRWVDLHSATGFGNVTGYIVVVDDEEDFLSPERLVEVSAPMVRFRNLPFGVHYWYVRAVYQDTNRTFGPPSPVDWFSFYNAPPRFEIVDPVKVRERQTTEIDMGRYISDVDSPVENLTLTSGDVHVVSIEGLTMTVRFPEPMGITWIRFSVADGHNVKLFNLPVSVIDVNDPPVIVSIGGVEPPVVIQVKEGSTVWLDVVAEDRDGEDLKLTLLTYWQDMRMFSNGSIRVRARHGMVGERTAKVLAEDPRRAVTSLRFTIRVINVPDPPEDLSIFGPKAGSSHYEHDPISFTVKVNDPDLIYGEEVNVSWESDISGPLMTKRTNDVASFTTNSLPVGTHTITVTAYDGHFTKMTVFKLTVIERPTPVDPEEPVEEGVPPLAILMLVLMLLMGYYLGRKGVGYARE